MDLSDLKKIIHFDSELGVVTLEPGVTQQDLYNFLSEKKSYFMVPTTGAGPHCSVLANALEKGYGLTPYEDHFGSLMNLTAVLPDGSIYRSSLCEFGGHRVDPICTYGPMTAGSG